MRSIAIAVALTVCALSPAFGQTQMPAPHPYDLDPYKPSDAALLRNYGATLVAQTPLLELRKLDPYVPSHADLLRQLGGAIPLWGIGYYPYPLIAAPTRPFASTVSPSAPAPGIILPRAESNDGVWITYARQKWTSAGPAVLLSNAEFVRIGQHAGVPVFRRTGGAENVIYVLMHDDVVAPYRLKNVAEGVR